MARQTRQQRQAAHRKAVKAEKAEIRRAMKRGGHLYAAEWYREYRINGDVVIAEAMEEMWDDLARHDREHPAPRNFAMGEDHFARMRDLERRRQEARDNERAAEIAEGARKKAAGIGGGLLAANRNTEPEPEDDGLSREAEEHECLRRELGSHGVLSRTPLAPGSERRSKRRKRYTPPPYTG